MRVFIFVYVILNLFSLFFRQDRLITLLSPGKSEQLQMIFSCLFFRTFSVLFFPPAVYL